MKYQSQTNNIVVANTDSVTSKFISEGIKELGEQYAVELVEFGTEALDKLAQQHYPILISGSFLPDMTGFNLARSAKADHLAAEVILIAPNNSQSFKDIADIPEIDHLIQNPISVEQIQYIVKKAFKLKPNASPLPTHPNPHQTDHVPPSSPEEPFAQNVKTDPPKSLETDTKQTKPQKPFVELQEQLQNLNQNLNGRCALLLNAKGDVVESAGASDQLNIANVSALVAANVMVTSELGGLVGNDSLFQSSYHKGSKYDIYSHSIGSNYFLVAIFDSRTKEGFVRFCFREVSEVLASLIKSEQYADHFSKAQIKVNIDQELDKLLLN